MVECVVVWWLLLVTAREWEKSAHGGFRPCPFEPFLRALSGELCAMWQA